MSFLKIVAVLSVVTLSSVECHLGFAVAPAPVAAPVLRYAQISPPSIRPFSAQVNTFSRNLHVFDAPYAAGVLPGAPAIVQRAVLPPPATPVFPAPFAAPAAPLLPRVATVASAFAPAAPVLPYAGGLYARSIPAIAPAFTPALSPPLAPAPLLG
ncbi:hypothetical protein GWI33_000781 [Rhynchophorus ferrugineus]|uniref:Uncharacterized protein n=1 Tax=Rhynchophorus ferrugineus TaxID=354439 RepID=A0A834HLV2_RHYFE|nr:hypothetical protein GWI33_000798 [Rhynchophorus ferrugineus]KAF7263993.1 hypothetical protein GWI33_000781 [Rhynchophorus ferrugineus]